MNTKLLMTSSAIVMGVTGILLSFLPDEASQLFGMQANSFQSLFFQILGALYFAFAMVNWTARANLIGGIYGRPIAIGNLTHFTVAGLAVLKYFMNNQSSLILPVLVVYAIFAICFGIVFFRHPVKNEEKD